jgi:hypothetical protein
MRYDPFVDLTRTCYAKGGLDDKLLFEWGTFGFLKRRPRAKKRVGRRPCSLLAVRLKLYSCLRVPPFVDDGFSWAIPGV